MITSHATVIDVAFSMAHAVSRRSGFDPGAVHVRFVV
jgi:hypothetical protein